MTDNTNYKEKLIAYLTTEAKRYFPDDMVGVTLNDDETITIQVENETWKFECGSDDEWYSFECLTTGVSGFTIPLMPEA